MAADSSQRAATSSTPRWTFDVFLSFRGEIRLGFTDHLYFALQSKGLIVFRDEERLEQGGNIRPELLKAIQESEFAVTVISENYASSTWCLDELAEIVKCKGEKGLKVLPVFYKVDPSDVRKQKGTFGMAFAKHVVDNVDEKQREVWRNALGEVCSISGWDVRNRHESEVVEEICKRIFDELSRQMLKIDDDIVGMDTRIKELMNLLRIRCDDIRFIGICGMGGIGKTTLAEVIYSKVFSRFEANCFILNIREEFQKFGSMLLLQKELVSQIFGKKELKIHNTFQGRNLIASMAKNKRVFIVLDDIDKDIQLEELVRNHNWFGKGSRVLITSRDGHLLKRHVDEIYEVEELNGHHALELFNLKAFKEHYYEGNYKQYSKEIVKYARGLPLALKIFGSFLFGCKADSWESALDRLKADPGSDLLDILKGTNSIESIVLKLPLSKPVIINFEALSNMTMLKMLVIQPIFEVGRDDQLVVEWRGDPSKLILSNELRILEWSGFSLNYLPNICDLDNLVSLKLPKKFIKQPRVGRKNLTKLRRNFPVSIWCEHSSLELEIPRQHVDQSINLQRKLDIGLADLQRSIGHQDPQRKLDMGLADLQTSIGHQDPQRNLQSCGTFADLNSISCLTSLVELDLSSYNLVDEVLPYDLSCLLLLKRLYLRENEFEKLSESISQLSNLCVLDLRGCTRLQTLPPGISQLSKLEGLYLDFCLRLKSLPPKLPFYLANLSVENCRLWGGFYGRFDVLTSGAQLLIGNSSVRGFYFGYDDKPYASIYLTQSLNGWLEQPPMKVSWGPTSKSEIPEWFKQRAGFFGMNQGQWFNQGNGLYGMNQFRLSKRTSTSFSGMSEVRMTLDVHAALSQALPLQRNENRSAMLMHWGLALFIVYEIHEPDNCERESKKQKADEHGRSTSRIFDGNSTARPAFVCEVEDKADSSTVSIGFAVPEVLPFGRNGVWACIRHTSFMSLFRNGIAVEGDKYFKPIRREIEVSIKTRSLNVEVKECGARVVHIPAFDGSGIRPPHDLFEVLSNISPHCSLLLDPETIWLGGKQRRPSLRL